jgi:putative Holliday junction resolvase
MTMQEDRTYIAVDYGRRRVGLAKSDPTGLIASALATFEVKSLRQAVDRVRAVIEEHKPAGLVIGWPLLASGDRGDMCDEIDIFVRELEPYYSGPVYRVDESGTSEEAADVIHAHGKRLGRKKKPVDRIAAVIILQRFLDETPAR